MLKGLEWICAAALVLTPAAPAGGGLPEAVADHDRHPGLGHPDEGEGHHEHGDPDDHHETPNSPCHHHDAHSCCAQGATLALVNGPAGPDAATSFRFLLPSIHAYASPAVVDLLHVPLV